MNDLNTALADAAAGYRSRVARILASVRDLPDRTQGHLDRMVNPSPAMVSHVEAREEAELTEAERLVPAYQQLAEAAEAGTLAVPRSMLRDPQFMRENQALIRAASRAGRYLVVDDE